ncbi:uncharacterized protein SPPG_03562 [Spizellomyces punctatus DAOM BR117]|uniref:DUF7789 domain-containing protein n=1 Tax=Spizellomyces punctatus (strain DAOM BR117) TaxID=645134 RepID=A0A0L0HLJ0_SPIPD|nr:uncharacterized protein SPPG_03562 [Spizellomyces punctatus DAOM BR117]KND01770.1 hypothetical protein SPPG_03562 [Spizellomyces punctatus DAOM BR117]|eukprot:XP_016609809.1 hypothetical protein SPPG_03562 [Spizellomyces punctatus DAOM BR117]
MIESVVGRIIFFATLVEAIIIIALESIVAAIFWKYFDPVNGREGPTRGIPVYLIIFIIGQLFQIYLCWDAVLHKNTIQIVAFVMFNLCVCLYSIFQYTQMIGLVEDNSEQVPFTHSDQETLKAVLLAIPIILGAFGVLFAICAWKLYLEFGWKIYKKIGADPKMRNMYRSYQFFIMLLKLDVFFVLGFGIQFLVLVIQKNDPEFALTIAALPIMMLVLVLAVYGLKREDKWIMGLFCCGVVLAMSYFVFKLVRIYMRKNEPQYSDTKHYLTFFACLSLAVMIMTFVNAIVCYRNFGKGLKEHIHDSRRQRDEAEFAAVSATRKPLED